VKERLGRFGEKKNAGVVLDEIPFKAHIPARPWIFANAARKAEFLRLLKAEVQPVENDRVGVQKQRFAKRGFFEHARLLQASFHGIPGVHAKNFRWQFRMHVGKRAARALQGALHLVAAAPHHVNDAALSHASYPRSSSSFVGWVERKRNPSW